MQSLYMICLAVLVSAEEMWIHKCCESNEMLSGDGRSCVDASWSRNHTVQERAERTSDGASSVRVQPGDAAWVSCWLPPGSPIHRVWGVRMGFLKLLGSRSVVLAVEASAVWNLEEMEAAHWPRGVVFDDHGYVLKREVFSRINKLYFNNGYCVDAANPPLGPFAVLKKPDCDEGECPTKCCEEAEVAEFKGGNWTCVDDVRGNWSPANSSFSRFLPPDLPFDYRKLQVARPGGGGERRKFLALSGFAWGLPALMTCLNALAFERKLLGRKWYSTSLMETRTCFYELAYITNINEEFIVSAKSGSTLFYYGPQCSLVLVNAICIAYTLRKVQFLRRGNSILHREEDASSPGLRQTGGKNPRTANSGSREGLRSTVADAKTIRMYLKMLLMTGVVELLAESIAWYTVNYSSNVELSVDKNSLKDHGLPYRVVGYVVDFLRSAIVAWLAAPEWATSATRKGRSSTTAIERTAKGGKASAIQAEK